MITDKTRLNKLRLVGYCGVLDSTWSLYTKSACVNEVSELLQEVETIREKMLIDAVKPVGLTSSEFDDRTSNSKSLQDYTVLLESLRQENKELREKLASEMSNGGVKSEKKSKEDLASLRTSKLSSMEREMAERKAKTYAVLEELNLQLKQFCVIGEKMTITKYV